MNKEKEIKKQLAYLLDTCNFLLTEEPDCTPTITLRSLIYTYNKETANAILDITKVIIKNPNKPSAYYIRSSCYLLNGEKDLAYRDFLRAMKLQFASTNPKFVNGYTEEVISNATIDEGQEFQDMQRVVNAEVNTLLHNYIPVLR